MNLYLSSYLIGDHADRLLALAGGKGARMAIITNALDYISFGDQLEFTKSQYDIDEYFEDQGFDPSLVDLRRYFGRKEALRRMLVRHKVIWAVGGNAFLLRRAMRESGFDDIIRDLLDSGLTYAGWSAGACVAGNSLRPVGQMDEPQVTARGYSTNDVIWEGLGLVPFAILPHYDSDHVEARSAAAAAIWAVEQNIDYRTLRDGEVLIAANNEAPTILPRTT